MSTRGGLFAPLFALALALASCTADAEAERFIAASAEDSEAADHALERGDRDAALERLRAIVERAVPRGVAEDDARVIRQDAFDRAARTLLAAGAPDEARAMVERGLALGERVDIFTANLLTTRGRIHEARGDDHRAARDYDRALRIQETLLAQALGE